MYTMGDVALKSVQDEGLLYKLFGINAELLIDHAWGYEPCTIADIKAYKPMAKSLSSGQVLHCPYTFEKARLVLREMCDGLVLDMVDKKVATSQAVLTVGYDIESLNTPGVNYSGEIVRDHYGRGVPKHAHGSINFPIHTSSTEEITAGILEIFDNNVNKNLLIRRLNVVVCNLIDEYEREKCVPTEQLDMFTDYSEADKSIEAKRKKYEREKQRQRAVIAIHKRFGGNAIIRGTSLEEGATAIDRNKQIGGHKA